MRSTRKTKNDAPLIALLIALSSLLMFGIVFFVFNYLNDDAANTEQPDNQAKTIEQAENDDEVEQSEGSESDTKEQTTKIRISAAGDIMFHQTQLTSGYDEATKTYDFKPVFEDVKPILSEANLAIANLETTLGGPEKGYSGYPLFNSPDEVIDALKYAGIDIVATANNHSLDTGSDGLKRTVQKLNENGIDTVGTYAEKPDSRTLLKDIEGIKIAILAYTESTNGLGSNYPADQLNNMLNLMTKENILRDIEEAKHLEADFIIAFMHWGTEYMEEPNEKQVEYAKTMAEAGVDLILGSHPHVVQKAEIIETGLSETFVIYSMGNFISNQRKETLGPDKELTEDGIIVHIDIEKNHLTNETKIANVEYVPTWVYRELKSGSPNKYAYRILPIADSLLREEISNEYKQRMERSYEATMAKMIERPF